MVKKQSEFSDPLQTNSKKKSIRYLIKLNYYFRMNERCQQCRGFKYEGYIFFEGQK